jgi:16S rRNA processing protein RimM
MARVLVAQIGAAHGLRGEVRLRSFTQDPMAVQDYALQSEDGARTLKIESLRPAKDFFVARFAGIADRSAAEALRNVKLYVPREHLPPSEPDEFYHADLIGLAAFDGDGRQLGTVAAMHNFGAGDIIEIKPPRGASEMLPFTAAVVPTIDLKAGRLIVNPPAGTFGSSTGEDDAPPSRKPRRKAKTRG